MKLFVLAILCPFTLAVAASAQIRSALCSDIFWISSNQAQNAEAIATEDVNAPCDLQMSPLHLAARYGTAADIAALVARGADVEAVSSTVGTPLHVAAHGLNVETITALVNAGGDVNSTVRTRTVAFGGSSPLHFAVARGGRVAHIAALLEAGADMEVKDRTGMTALDVAIWLEIPEKAKFLRAAGAIESEQ